MNKHQSGQHFRLVTTGLLLAALLTALISASFAWFADPMRPTPSIPFSASSVASYFGGGTGTSTDPFIINAPVHLYNLAWLQNTESISPGTYFKLTTDINMAGELDDETKKSGAIPPIGTDENPFQGHFDGQGKVISNLWVSTNPTDWKEHPGIEELTFKGNYVGLFGEIGEGGIVTNFVLDRVEVTSNISGQSPATVGIVCGYVGAGAHVSKVGVYNGKISCSGANIESNYSLIGAYDEEHLSWEDRPGSSGSSTDPNTEGGNIIVDANTQIDGEYNFSNISTEGKVVPVKGSASGRAFYVGTLIRDAMGGQPTIRVNNNGSYPEYDYSNEDPLVKATIDLCLEKKYFIKVSETVDVTKTQAYQIDQKTIYLPSNGVWFQPKEAGTASIAFTKTVNNKDSYMQVYQYKNDQWIAIPECKFILPKQGVQNNHVIYYEFEVEKEVQYFIGKTSGDSAGFVMLVLAGASDTNGPTTDTDDQQPTTPQPGFLQDIDYILSPTPNFDWDNHKQSEVLLSFSGTNITGSIIYRAAVETVDSATVQKVYYNNQLGEG